MLHKHIPWLFLVVFFTLLFLSLLFLSTLLLPTSHMPMSHHLVVGALGPTALSVKHERNGY